MKVSVITGIAPSSTGLFNISKDGGLGWTPVGCLVFMGFADTTSNPRDGASWSIGASDGTRQWVIAADAENNIGNTDTGRYHANNNIAASYYNGSALQLISFSSFHESGVTLNYNSGTTTTLRYLTTVLFGGDDCEVYAGFPQLSAGANNITAPNFEPSGVIFATVGLNTAPPAAATIALTMFGFAINNSGVNQGFMGFSSTDAAAAAINYYGIRNDSAIGQLYNTGFSWYGTVSDFNSQGFTITPNVDPASDYIGYFAIKGSTKMDARWNQTPSTSGVQSVTYNDYNFTPQTVIGGFGKYSGTMNSYTGTGMQASHMGVFAFDNSVQRTIAIYDEDGADPTITKSYKQDSALYLYEFNATQNKIAYEATFNSFTPSGYILDYSTVDDTSGKDRYFWSMAFEAEASPPASSTWTKVLISTKNGNINFRPILKSG